MQKFGEVEEGKEKCSARAKNTVVLVWAGDDFEDVMVAYTHGMTFVVSIEVLFTFIIFPDTFDREKSPHPYMLPKGTHGFLTSPIHWLYF